MFASSSITFTKPKQGNTQMLSDVKSKKNILDQNGKVTTRRRRSTRKIKFNPRRIGKPSNMQDAYDFVLEIYDSYRKHEMDRQPPKHYMKNLNFKPKTRKVLIDFLIGIHKEMEMHTDTLYSAVTIFDLYLSKNKVKESDLALILCTSLLIASKNEEMQTPVNDDFVYLSGDAFSSDDMNRMEFQILQSLDFNVNVIHSSIFLKAFLRYANTTVRLSMIAHFINEVLLLSQRFIGSCPSKRAAAVLCIAMFIENGSNQWNHTMERNTGYCMAQLLPMISKIIKTFNRKKDSKYRAVFQKYSLPELFYVSKISLPKIEQFQ
ncbi:Cyclin, N-terminal domain containing protein [Histomonas meleagridis]|uniref:Cyclin, N-terminal domain containing protein n=1 Tax=Histomonas meleagridis TaxID=135588 RepID=UPI00355A08BD|nr:Cyclin, N-terminal domain containing protein [Histomonas meleagridis]KAH0798557.1 Cyclin, N-terminal domain containing protein [Histomonas meleagridis]